MTRHLRQVGAPAALLAATLTFSALTAAGAGAAAPPRRSAGTTLNEVTQQAIAASGRRQRDASGAIVGNRVDGRANAAEAARIVANKPKTARTAKPGRTRTPEPKGGRAPAQAITPAAALSAYGMLTTSPQHHGMTAARGGAEPMAHAAAPAAQGGAEPMAQGGAEPMAQGGAEPMAQGGAEPMAHAAALAAAPAAADPAGAPTVPQDVTFQGPTDVAPAVGGAWENYALRLPDGPVGAVHSVVLATGKVLIIAGSGNNYSQFAAGEFRSWLWDPEASPGTAFTSIATPYDMFCAGHVQLADGTLLIAGGTSAYPQYDADGTLLHDWDGSKKSYIFDIRTNRYVAVGSMANARWYPGMVQRGDGSVLSVGGLDDTARSRGVVSHNTDTVEQYDPASKTWRGLPSLNFSNTDPSYPVPAGPVGTTRTLPYYPGLVQLEDGRVFYSGQSNGDNGVRPGIWDPATGGFQSLASPSQPYTRNAGATVLLPPAQKQQVMIMGGGDYSSPATRSTARIDLKRGGTAANPDPAYVEGPPLSAAKMYVGAVTLPNYKVFETNGASDFRQGGVHSAGMYDPATNTMTTMNSPTIDRLYHSEALLLPSGDVAVLGSQPLDGSFEMTISLYHPPYSYTGQRPKINFGVDTLNYWGGDQGYYDITVAPGATLSKISLLRPSATTHSTDNDQRLVDLPFRRSPDGRAYTVQVPTNPNLIPPGPYMMFALDSAGRPSAALWVTVAPAG